MNNKNYFQITIIFITLLLINKISSGYSGLHSNTYIAGDCQFKLNNLMGGTFSVDTLSSVKGGVYSSPTGDREFSVPIYCYTGSQQDDIDSQLSAKKLNGHWVSANTGTPFDANEHFRVIEFNGTNWRGIATTYDQNIGEEDFRQRVFQYCLLETNGTQILCGHLGVMTLAKPSTNIMYDVLTILKSVEFVAQRKEK